MSLKVNKCELKDVLEIFPQIFVDNRGCFVETYNQRDFAQLNLNDSFVQDNQSESVKNVFRGLHFQKKHSQAKLIRCISGKVLDILVDLRTESSTFGKSTFVTLDSELKNMLYIPKGIAHGFFVLSDSAVINYKCSDFYYPEDEDGLCWNDVLLNLNLPFNEQEIIINPKDLKYPEFNPDKKYFDLNGNWLGE